MIVSLVRYADACEPSNRHSDCPYAVDRQGQLSCHEECRGVITSLLRRGRGATSPRHQAFDAGQFLLSEPRGAPDILWYTSSLLQIVVQAMRTHPLRRDGTLNLQRYIYATSSLGALGCRGLDPDQLVRYGLAKTVKLGLAGWLGRLQSSDDPRSRWEHADRWRAIFNENDATPGDPGEYIRAALTGQVAQNLAAWIQAAPLEDLLLWKPPDSLSTVPSTGLPEEQQEFWTWIVERFTQTYLERWSAGSLKREYEFVCGSWHPPLPTHLLAERTETREKIAIALADRTLVGSDKIDPSTMISLIDQALTLLADGQRNAAAALFDGARRLKPGDMDAQNNYAFCILIDHPDQAQRLLEEAVASQMQYPAIALCNLALAEWLIGNADKALETCERAYDAANESEIVGHLWQKPTDGEWTVVETKFRPWIVRLGTEVASSLGASDNIWSERLSDLSLVEPAETSSNPSSEETGVEDL